MQEDALWAYAKNENTVESYMKYANLYKNGKFTDKCNDVIDSINWNEAIKLDTYNSIITFYNSFPDSKYREEANSKIDSILNKDWKQTNTLEEYILFDKTYPNSKYSEKVQSITENYIKKVDNCKIYTYQWHLEIEGIENYISSIDNYVGTYTQWGEGGLHTYYHFYKKNDNYMNVKIENVKRYWLDENDKTPSEIIDKGDFLLYQNYIIKDNRIYFRFVKDDDVGIIVYFSNNYEEGTLLPKDENPSLSDL